MERSEEMMDNVISCINTDDKDGLKRLFSEAAKERTDTLDNDLDYILNHHSVVLCAGYDKENPNKITHISIVDCNKDSTPLANSPPSDTIINAGLGDVLDIYRELHG